MATYAVGDVHGCYRELRRLLDDAAIDWDQDRLWLVGDIVNRGPQSLRTLRWARKTRKQMGQRFQMVLGNHDLRLLAMAAGIVEPRATDTAQEILEAPDRRKLLRWLTKRPLVHRERGYLLVHAGLWARWDAGKAERWARRVETALRKGKGKARMLLDPATEAATLGRRSAKLHHALEAFTRLRICSREGRPVAYTGPPKGAPEGCVPWFEAPDRKSAKATVVCGHWAALGLHLRPHLVALDSGCVWGGTLTAVRLEDRAVFSQRRL